MRIDFVTVGNGEIASFRYHNEIPARELSLLGHEAIISTYPQFNQDAYVFSKHFNYGDFWYQESVRARGAKTFFHVCDDHFGSDYVDHYKRMIANSGGIICPTLEMAEKVRKETGRDAVVIPDPYELPLLEPCYKPTGEKLKVLWFGHTANLESLEKVLPLPSDCELRICTRLRTPKGKQIDLPIIFNKIPYLEWSIANLLFCLEWCDVVILPMDLNEKNNCKSANRIVEAVRRRKFVIASPLISYRAFDNWMYIGDIHEGLKWVQKQDAEEINDRIELAQEYVEEIYSPKVVGKRWEEVLSA